MPGRKEDSQRGYSLGNRRIPRPRDRCGHSRPRTNSRSPDLYRLLPGWIFPAQSQTAPDSAQSPPKTLILGFVGGFVRSDDTRHSEVQMIHGLQQKSMPGVEAQIFRNSDSNAALQRILNFLDEDRDGTVSTAEKQRARIILFGYSWGGSAIMKLTQELDRRDIPVALLIQLDSVGKHAPNICLVPANVRQAVNFYQTKLPVRGCQVLRAIDPARTTILANIRFQYPHQPPECRALPWRDRWFLRSHNSIGCDPHVWSQVEQQIDIALGAPAAAAPSPPKATSTSTH
jgi:hypothetical protein